jgi:hypothetical protein
LIEKEQNVFLNIFVERSSKDTKQEKESNVFTSSQVNTPSTVAISVINVSEYATEQDLLTLLRAWNLPQPLSVHFLEKKTQALNTTSVVELFFRN